MNRAHGHFPALFWVLSPQLRERRDGDEEEEGEDDTNDGDQDEDDDDDDDDNDCDDCHDCDDCGDCGDCDDCDDCDDGDYGDYDCDEGAAILAGSCRHIGRVEPLVKLVFTSQPNQCSAVHGHSHQAAASWLPQKH